MRHLEQWMETPAFVRLRSVLPIALAQCQELPIFLRERRRNGGWGIVFMEMQMDSVCTEVELTVALLCMKWHPLQPCLLREWWLTGEAPWPHCGIGGVLCLDNSASLALSCYPVREMRRQIDVGGPIYSNAKDGLFFAFVFKNHICANWCIPINLKIPPELWSFVFWLLTSLYLKTYYLQVSNTQLHASPLTWSVHAVCLFSISLCSDGEMHPQQLSYLWVTAV